jgi:methionyl-tRNA formyltransferase
MADRKILYITCGENGFYCLRRMVKAGRKPVAVVCLQPQLEAKYNISGFADPAGWCREQGIPVIALETYKLEASHVSEVDYDVVVVNGWNRLIPGDVFSKAKHGGLGIHAGHPPIGLGRAPIVWNILLGRTDIEVYVFRLTERADDGDIMALRPVEIGHADSVADLYEKVMFASVELFTTALNRLSDGYPGQKQNMAFAKHYEKRTPDDGAIDFTQSEKQIYDFVRAQCPPYPGAFAFLNGKKWKIHRVIPFDTFAFRETIRTPGMILDVLPSGPIVCSGGYPVWIKEAYDEDGNDLIAGESDHLEALVGQVFTAEA